MKKSTEQPPIWGSALGGDSEPESSIAISGLYLKYGLHQIIGSSRAIFDLFELIEKVKDTDSTVFITGESGTGKEVVARALHFHSHRAPKPFVTVNCGAIPRELLEAELFGHVKGAFTGAIASREGRFQAADGGTIFLDEIGEIDPSIQVKLLRVIQEKTFEPVGSSETMRVNVRIIAATNRDLALAVKKQEIREDLFYRLNVIPIFLHPLRARKVDIPLLVKHFLAKFCHKHGKQEIGIRKDAMEFFINYSWPGNVRELENLIERLVILKETQEIVSMDLPSFILQQPLEEPTSGVPRVILPKEGIDFKSVIDEFENQLIVQALERTQWNRKQAASLLHLNRTTLVEKIKKKKLQPRQ